jgi:hypothetical protein
MPQAGADLPSLPFYVTEVWSAQSVHLRVRRLRRGAR